MCNVAIRENIEDETVREWDKEKEMKTTTENMNIC